MAGVATGVVAVAAEADFALARVLALKHHRGAAGAFSEWPTNAASTARWQVNAAGWRALCSPCTDGEMAQQASAAFGV